MTFAGFPLRPLGEIAENHDAKRRPVKASDRKSGPYPYYGAQGVVDHVDDYLFDGEFLLVAEDGENLRSRKEDVALLANGKFWVNNHAHIIRGSDAALTRFLLYAINQADVSGYVTGSTIPKLSQGNLNRLLVPCPSVDVQQRVVNLLGSLDEKIELNRRMNETLEAMARAIFKDWFVDFGPTRAKMEGHTPYLAPHIWALFPDRLDGQGKPGGWRTSAIGEEVTVVGGSTPSTKEPAFWEGIHAWATPKDLSSLSVPVLLSTERSITDAGLSQIGSGLLPEGTVLLSSRAPIGYLAISQVPTAINQGFIAMICDGGVSNVHAWLWTQANLDLILQHANGSTFQEISKKNFKPLPIDVADPTTLDAFDKTVQPLFAHIVANERENRTIAATRDLLVPKLMSGEIRIRDAEAMIAAAA